MKTESTTKSKLNTRKRVQLKCPERSLTEQTHKQSCDINYIVNKFQQTGQLPNNINQNPQYGFAPEIDFKNALDLTKKLNQEFAELSLEDRAKFDHNPQIYGDFLQQYAESPESFYNINENESDTLALEPVKDSKEASLDTKD